MATRRKKISTGAKIAIGLGVLAGGWLIYDNFIKKDETAAPPVLPPTNDAANLIAAVNQVPQNQLPQSSSNQAVRVLSPKGTPTNKQQWGARLYKGDRGGEIETFQKLLNRVAKAYNSDTIAVDGVWGAETERKKQKVMGTGTGLTLNSTLKVVKKAENKAAGLPDASGLNSWSMFLPQF